MNELNLIATNGKHKIESSGTLHAHTSSDIELEWCESEILKTESESIALYRAELNKYKSKLSGGRPEL